MWKRTTGRPFMDGAWRPRSGPGCGGDRGRVGERTFCDAGKQVDALPNPDRSMPWNSQRQRYAAVVTFMAWGDGDFPVRMRRIDFGQVWMLRRRAERQLAHTIGWSCRYATPSEPNASMPCPE